MDRRHFLQLSAGTVAMTAVNGWASRYDASRSTSTTSSRDLSAAEFHSARKFIKTDQGRIACIDQGKGPGALFLHGFPLNSFQWRGVIPRLSEHRRCIAPDFLGLGYTEVAKGQSVVPSSQVAMIAQLFDKLSIPFVDVIANDSGGAVAQLFVARYPKRVRSLLLTNCDTEPDSPPAAALPVIELARGGKFADEWLVPWLADKVWHAQQRVLGAFAIWIQPTRRMKRLLPT